MWEHAISARPYLVLLGLDLRSAEAAVRGARHHVCVDGIAVAEGLADIARHVFQRTLNPRLLIWCTRTTWIFAPSGTWRATSGAYRSRGRRCPPPTSAPRTPRPPTCTTRWRRRHCPSPPRRRSRMDSFCLGPAKKREKKITGEKASIGVPSVCVLRVGGRLRVTIDIVRFEGHTHGRG
jgi:hypothetical protein